jgi:quinol-cytochrome oxidoreductase complex cytochrome b subunit
MNRLSAWLRDRTGLPSLGETLRGPASWNAAFGGVVGVLVLVQGMTGISLAAYYKPTLEGAYPSVQFILFDLRLGWLIRSLHLWGQHLLVLSLLSWLGFGLVRRSYEKPRELSWFLLVGALFTVLLAGQTGQVLPLDEDGWNGALIASNVAGPAAPWVLGGRSVSDFTVGRFFAAHALVLPLVWGMALLGHHALHRRHPEFPGGTYLERLGLGAALALALLSTLAVAFPLGVGPRGSATGVSALAKPHWYLLPVYQILKFAQVWQANLALGAVFLFLLSLPFQKRAVALAGSVVVIGTLVALGVLGALAR